MSILAHSLGTVLCYDILCHQQEQAAPGACSPSRPVPMSLPASPAAQHRRQPQGPAEAAHEAEAEEMEIDLTADSPGAALQQELSRLRAENQRLRLQLDLAKDGTDGTAAGGGGTWGPKAGGVGSPGAPGEPPGVQQPATQRQQHAAEEGAEGGERYPPRLRFV